MKNYRYRKTDTRTLRHNRRRLIRKATPSEEILRDRLRKLNIKFCFQELIAPYIIDFLLTKKKICIEVDGNSHNSKSAGQYDGKKDKFLSSLGFTVIRIQNSEVSNYSLEFIKAMPNFKGSKSITIARKSNRNWHGKVTLDSLIEPIGSKYVKDEERVKHDLQLKEAERERVRERLIKSLVREQKADMWASKRGRLK